MVFRTIIALVGGFVLIFVESYIVLVIKGYHSVEFGTGGWGLFISVWAMNFFLLFTMFTHVKLWLDQKEEQRQTIY